MISNDLDRVSQVCRTEWVRNSSPLEYVVSRFYNFEPTVYSTSYQERIKRFNRFRDLSIKDGLLERLVALGLWMRGPTKMGKKTFLPLLHTKVTMAELVPMAGCSRTETFPERFSLERMERYLTGGGGAHAHNAASITNWLQDQTKRKKGRQTEEEMQLQDYHSHMNLFIM